MDFKQLKKLSYDEIDFAISNRQAEIDANFSKIKPFQDEISRLDSEIKNLRDVKSQKIIDDSKQVIIDSQIDFSLEDFQQFLLSKKNLKVTSNKKILNKKNSDKNFSQSSTAKKNSPTPADVGNENFSATPKSKHADSEKFTDTEFLQKSRTQTSTIDVKNLSAQENDDLIPTGLPDKISLKSHSKYVSAFDEEDFS